MIRSLQEVALAAAVSFLVVLALSYSCLAYPHGHGPMGRVAGISRMPDLETRPESHLTSVANDVCMFFAKKLCVVIHYVNRYCALLGHITSYHQALQFVG